MPRVDLNEVNEAQRGMLEKRDSAVEQLAVALQELADKNTDRTLAGNFWLNQIQSKDDSLRHMLSIDALMVGAFAAILFNNLFNNIDFWSSMLSEAVWQIGLSSHGIFELGLMILILIQAIGPILCWCFSIIMIMNGLGSKPITIDEVLLNADDFLKFLETEYKNKCSVLRSAGFLFILGIFLIIFDVGGIIGGIIR